MSQSVEEKAREIRNKKTQGLTPLQKISVIENEKSALLASNMSIQKTIEDYNKSIAEDETYNVESPTKAGYTADQTVIAGTMGKQNIEVTVTYTPVNDKNNNGVADEEEPKEITNETEDIVPSPKTSDNIISYFILEIISLVAAVIIFIRIKAQ